MVGFWLFLRYAGWATTAAIVLSGAAFFLLKGDKAHAIRSRASLLIYTMVVAVSVWLMWIVAYDEKPIACNEDIIPSFPLLPAWYLQANPYMKWCVWGVFGALYLHCLTHIFFDLKQLPRLRRNNVAAAAIIMAVMAMVWMPFAIVRVPDLSLELRYGDVDGVCMIGVAADGKWPGQQQVVPADLTSTILLYNEFKLGGEGYIFDGEKTGYLGVSEHLRSMDRNAFVRISCMPDSPQGHLMTTLKLCVENSITNIEIVTSSSTLDPEQTNRYYVTGSVMYDWRDIAYP